MAKLTVDARPREEVNYTRSRSTRLPDPAIPTGDYRHISKVREGAQSAEVWSLEQRARWHEEYDGPTEPWQKLKEGIENASQSLSEGGTKSLSKNAKAVRDKKRAQRVLRDGKQEGQGEVSERESQKRLQKTKAIKKKVTKKGKN
jgi:hypothetical protein